MFCGSGDMQQKLKVLAWSDSVLASTGFGTVSRHVLTAVHRTGRYQIDQLAINYGGEFYDQARYPVQISPAKLLDPNDHLGKLQLLRSLERGDYDVLWILNDLHVPEPIVKELGTLRERKRAQTGKTFKTIVYFPVDGHVYASDSSILELADAAITYTQFGRRAVLQSRPQVEDKLRVIYHGSDIETFRRHSDEFRHALRQKFGLADPQTFLVVNVSMNYPRKDLPRSILAFSEFKKRAPNSVLYLHTEPNRPPFELLRCCECAGLGPKDVRFPQLPDQRGFPIDAMNNIYNAADVLLTTTLGEGWGLTMNEAMCAGTPVVAPDNSSIPELLGGDGDRGYVYECAERVWVDNGGYRPAGSIEAIVAKLMQCYEERGSPRQRDIVSRAAQFTREHTWDIICKQWVEVFDGAVGVGKT